MTVSRRLALLPLLRERFELRLCFPLCPCSSLSHIVILGWPDFVQFPLPTFLVAVALDVEERGWPITTEATP